MVSIVKSKNKLVWSD
jgi:hypothetical protein